MSLALAIAAVVLQQKPVVLAVDNFIIGERVSGKWKPLTNARAKRMGPTTFASFTIGEVHDPIKNVPIKPGDPDVGVPITIDSDLALGAVRISGVKPKVPRPVRLIDEGNRTYEKYLQSFLDTHGLKGAKARATKIVKVDLDGDGRDEVLIEARSRDEFPGDKTFDNNDYSLVMLRSMKGKSIQQRALKMVSQRHDKYLEAVTIRGIADIGGKGIMDVVLDGTGYEWNNAQLYEYRKGMIKLLIQNGEGE